MSTTVTLRKILDRKQWELLAPSVVGSSDFHGCSSTLFDQYQMWMQGASTVYLYDPREDAWARLPNSGMTSFAGLAGALCFHPSGPTGTASAGSATTITTTLTLPGSLAGYTIRITGGTGAGQERTIASNTYGSNSVITVAANWTTNPDNTSVYLLLTGRFYAFYGSGTPALKYFDLATNAWSGSLSGTGVTQSGTDWRLTATPGFGATIATGTATAGAGSTLTNSGKAWATNQWASYQVRLTGGTGAGQVRTIASNTGTVLTVSSAWSTNPDSTSTYVLEANDDFLYLAGGSAVALYRYSISGNTWSTLSPGTARSVAPGAGTSLSWIAVASDASWADETNIKNGRYLYSFQGASSGNLSYYDISANTWVNLTTTYQRGGGADVLVAAGGYHMAVDREFIYIVQVSPVSVVTCWRFNAVTQSLDPWAMYYYPFNAAGNGNRATIASYTDGGTTIRWVYIQPGSATAGLLAPFLRMMVI